MRRSRAANFNSGQEAITDAAGKDGGGRYLLYHNRPIEGILSVTNCFKSLHKLYLLVICKITQLFMGIIDKTCQA